MIDMNTTGFGGGEPEMDMGESFAAMFEESLKREDVKEGDIVRGRVDRKSTRLNSSHGMSSRMPSSA